MERLKSYLKNSEIAINESIVLVQSEIDKLFEEHLNELVNNKVAMEMKNGTKQFYYGWLGAIQSVSKKIKEIEENDMFEFELALDELNISERELKADV